MKITKKYLRELIKEETTKLLREETYLGQGTQRDFERSRTIAGYEVPVPPGLERPGWKGTLTGDMHTITREDALMRLARENGDDFTEEGVRRVIKSLLVIEEDRDVHKMALELCKNDVRALLPQGSPVVPSPLKPGHMET